MIFECQREAAFEELGYAVSNGVRYPDSDAIMPIAIAVELSADYDASTPLKEAPFLQKLS